MAVRVRRIIATVYCLESEAEMVRQELNRAFYESAYELWRPSEPRIDAGEAAEAREAEQRFEEKGIDDNDVYDVHSGGRPMQIEWILDRPMPAGFYQETKIAAG